MNLANVTSIDSLRARSSEKVSMSGLPGPRSIEVKGSGSSERDVSVQSTGSIASLLKDSTSLTKRLEAMEQQMLATHMRAAAAPEAAEVVAQNMVAPFSDEISALKARVEMAEQQITTCASSNAMERLSQRMSEAEVRMTIGGSVTDGGSSSTSMEHAVLLARMEERMNVMSRELHDNVVKVQDLESGRPDPLRMEQCVTDSVAAMLQENNSRQGSEVDDIKSRLEALEQQLTLVQREVVDVSMPQNTAVAGLADRISAMESSYQEMGGAILRHQETIRPLIENEISGLVIRLDAQEKMIQTNAAQAICRQQLQEDNEKQKDSHREDVINRMTDVEEKMQALTTLSQQTSTLSARVSVAEKQMAAAPSAAEWKKLQADLQAAVQAAETQGAKAAQEARASGTVEANAKLGFPPPMPQPPKAVASEEVAHLHAVVDDVRNENSRISSETSRLAQELAEERKERYLALADVNRLSEVVAKAAASTIERAEQRFSEELGAEREKLRQELVAAKEMSLSMVSTSSMKDSATCQETASVSSASEMNRQSMLKSGKGATLGIGSDLARCVGEMDAELRVELTGCLDAVHKDLDTLRADLSVRMGTVEKRLLAVEEHTGAEMKSVAEEPNTYNVSDGQRVGLRPHSRTFTQKVDAPLAPASSGPASSAGDMLPQAKPSPVAVSRDTGSYTGPPNMLPNASASSYAGTTSGPPSSSGLEALQRNTMPAPQLTDVFQQAMKQMIPQMLAEAAATGDKRAASPVRQPEISEDLKANLRNLVSAVNRTLGDTEGSSERAPSATGFGAARSYSPNRSSSPTTRNAANAAGSQSVPPGSTVLDQSVLSNTSAGSLHIQPNLTPPAGQSAAPPEALQHRGRSTDANAGRGSGASPVPTTVPHRSFSPPGATLQSPVGSSQLNHTTGNISAATAKVGTTPSSTLGKSPAKGVTDPTNTTWPGYAPANATRQLQSDRIMQAAGMQPSAQAQAQGQGQGPMQSRLSAGMPAMGGQQPQSPRARATSHSSQPPPVGGETRALSRSTDASSVPRATMNQSMMKPGAPQQYAPQQAQAQAMQAPGQPAAGMSRSNLRSGWKR